MLAQLSKLCAAIVNDADRRAHVFESITSNRQRCIGICAINPGFACIPCER